MFDYSAMGTNVLLFVSILSPISVTDENSRLITCGSAIKLRHIESRNYYLKSLLANWGSGQQVVTLAASKDPETLWQVRCQILGPTFQCVALLYDNVVLCLDAFTLTFPQIIFYITIVQYQTCNKRFERLTTPPPASLALPSNVVKPFDSFT